MNKLKRILALTLVLCMLCSFLPAGAFAAGNDAPAITGTTDAPFKKGTGGSNSFRIPAIVTLSDGTLVAAADARWNTTYDGGGLDTMVAISTDGGQSWEHSFANYLADNGNQYDGDSSTCFIDPSLAVYTTDANNDGTGEDTIFMLCDLYPYGIAINGSGNTAPSTAVGFNADGKLLLSGGCYLDDTVIRDADGNEVSGLIVDAHFNVTGTYGGSEVNSNLFFSDSPFKVMRTGFLYLTKSTDGGKSWSDPELLNLKTGDEQVCLVGPGGGMVTSNGVIVFPVYSYSNGTERTGLIYSEDGGQTWERSTSLTMHSSEADAVELDNGELRVFFRNKTGRMHYADYNLTMGSWGTPVDTGVRTNSNTQLSAITYSLGVEDNGVEKTVILVSCPASANLEGSGDSNGSMRTSGRIFAGLVDPETYEMTWLSNSFPLTPVANSRLEGNYTAADGFFAYSSMTQKYETNDIAVLYEDNQFGWGTSDDNVDKYYTIAYKTVTEEALAEALGVTFAGSPEIDDPDNEDGDDTLTQESLTVILGSPATATIDGVCLENGSKEDEFARIEWVGTEAISAKGVRRSDSAVVDLTDCMFTFTDHEETGYYVVESASYARRYLNNTMPDASVNKPISATPGKISVSLGHTDMFRLQNNNVQGSSYGKPYSAGLHFHTELSDPYWDRCGTDTSVQCHEYLYRPAKAGEASSTEIPGFVRLKSDDEIESGKAYLIAHVNVDNNYYVLFPGTSQYECVVKVDPTTKATPAATAVTITGKYPGNTSFVVGTTQYNITVEPADIVTVPLKLGQTTVITDNSGNYQNKFTDLTPAGIADMTVTGTDAVVNNTTLEPVTAENFDASKEYVIECVRSAKSSHAAYAPNHSVLTSDGFGNGLDTNGPKDANTSQRFTIEGSDGKYYIGRNNQVITLDSVRAAMADKANAEKLTLAYVDGQGWLIYVDNDGNGPDNGDYFLSDYNGTAWREVVGYDQRNDDGNYWNIYEVVVDSTPAKTEITFEGLLPGEASTIVGNTQYNITVEPEHEVDVELDLGESKVYTDNTGNYADEIRLNPDDDIAEMTVTGSNGDPVYTVSSDKATAPEANTAYIIRYLNSDQALTSNQGGTTWRESDGSPRKFETYTGPEADNMWTLEPSGDGYKIKCAEGYLNLGRNAAWITADGGDVFTLTYSNGGWEISDGTYSMDALGGLNAYHCAGGWPNSGTRFDLYKVTETYPNASTSITFTSVSEGKTTAIVGTTLYNITVKPTHTVPSSRTSPMR